MPGSNGRGIEGRLGREGELGEKEKEGKSMLGEVEEESALIERRVVERTNDGVRRGGPKPERARLDRKPQSAPIPPGPRLLKKIEINFCHGAGGTLDPAD